MDNFLLHQLNQFAGRWNTVDYLVIFIAGWLPYLAAILLFWLFLKKENFGKTAFFKIGFSIITALIIRFPIVWFIQLFVNRQRPFVVDEKVVNILSHDPSKSFPSGHATFFFTLAAMLFLLDRKLGSLLFLVVILMGIARIFAGVHWPSDILAGAAIGIATGSLIYFFAKRFHLFPK